MRVDIGAVRAIGKQFEYCDAFAITAEKKYCDPYFKVFIDGQQNYTTKVLFNAIGYQSFDKVFHSKRISYDSIIKFQLLDNDGNDYPGLLLDESMTIKEAESKYWITNGRSIIFINVFWKPEFTNQKVDEFI